MPSLWIFFPDVLVLSCGQIESHTEAADRYTHSTTVGMSECCMQIHTYIYRVAQKMGPPAILSNCKYSENSMTELRGNW